MRQAERGFTLLEVIVVLAILAMVAGLVLSRGPPRSGALEMREAAALVSGTLRVARSRAIASNRDVAVRLDRAAATIRLGDEAAKRLPAGIAIAAAPATILFRPEGGSTGGLVELSGGARTAKIAVSWLTGRVEMGAETH